MARKRVRKKQKRRSRCDFVPKYGLAGKYDREDYGYILTDITNAISDVEGVCNQSYYTGDETIRQVMVKIAAKDKKSAKKAMAAMKRAGMDDLIYTRIEPWEKVRQYW